MRLSTVISTETKQKLLDLSHELKLSSRSNTDRQRELVKGKYYADEICKIRLLTKKQLVKYIEQKRNDRGVKLGTKIAHSSNPSMYRMLDDKIRMNIELMNYARNRLYAS